MPAGKQKPCNALVTGASSGIGAATARTLAAHGLHVQLVARRADSLAAIAEDIRAHGGTAMPHPADLTDERQRVALFEKLSNANLTLDILVNNAGFGWYGYYNRMPWSTALEMLELNITAVAHLTHLFLPSMRAQALGHIINIGSIAGSIPSQGVALYSATKSFIDGFSTALHRELKGSGVHVSVVRAGPVATEFFTTAAHRPAGQAIPAERFATTAQLVAERIWRLIQRPRRAIYVPASLRFIPWIETGFGWLMDRIGPLLLRRST